jgi:hypothetical protein
MNQYFAKIKLYYQKTTPIYQIAVKTFGETPEEARINVENMVHAWEGIKKFEILIISTRPIYLNYYIAEADLYYYNGQKRNIKLNLKAESKEETKTIATEIIKGWKHISSHIFLNIELHN